MGFPTANRDGENKSDRGLQNLLLSPGRGSESLFLGHRPNHDNSGGLKVPRAGRVLHQGEKLMENRLRDRVVLKGFCASPLADGLRGGEFVCGHKGNLTARAGEGKGGRLEPRGFGCVGESGADPSAGCPYLPQFTDSRPSIVRISACSDWIDQSFE